MSAMTSMARRSPLSPAISITPVIRTAKFIPPPTRSGLSPYGVFGRARNSVTITATISRTTQSFLATVERRTVVAISSISSIGTCYTFNNSSPTHQAEGAGDDNAHTRWEQWQQHLLEPAAARG